MKRFVTILLAACSVAGCATTSFAPPIVKMDKELTSTGNQTFFNATCTPKPGTRVIQETVAGARRLIQNFILTYRCQAHRAAEGRQFFEVPGFLVAAGSATAAAFGAPSGVAIAAGAAGAVLGQGKSYYSPQDKAGLFDHSLDALLCIKTEAVGIDAYTLEAISAVEETSGNNTKAVVSAARSPEEEGPGVTVSSEEQYFDMVQAALLSVERVTAQRLSSSGTPFDAAGVMAEIEALRKKAEPEPEDKPEADAAADALVDSPSSVPGASVDGAAPSAQMVERLSVPQRDQAFAAATAKRNIRALTKGQVSDTILRLKSLQPRLQQCVVRAKMG